ncbi:TetR/AcrR family transcriptional regulator [Methylocystis heyeri]|uniref:TetR family transcriptional regulator n=1 Tax=Methylocystis heyeri TaxID=391905 RepID=A0A6B8KM47_9HYPH|nr:TetR family transcriptional regulator [Methylocystis heyeri]QGM47928.1 TetR family transcriptional regulator [Methylocystis heyeri]
MGASDTRRQIVEAADRLFYERGFEATSFADIAEAVGLSRGNFYYHFKAKDEILAAVIERRAAKTHAMLREWEGASESARERIRAFVHILIANKTMIMAHGCPVGTLCSELARLEHVAKNDASGILSLFRDWLARQFAALGRQAEADALALHILMRSQGVAALAAAFRDEEFIRREVEAMEAWLENQCAAASSLKSRPRL